MDPLPVGTCHLCKLCQLASGISIKGHLAWELDELGKLFGTAFIYPNSRLTEVCSI